MFKDLMNTYIVKKCHYDTSYDVSIASTKKIDNLLIPYIHSINKKNNCIIYDPVLAVYNLIKIRKLILEIHNNFKSKILYVGTSIETKGLAKEYSELTKSHYITKKWPNGFLTNWHVVKENIERNFSEYKKYKNNSFKLKTLQKKFIKFEGINSLDEFPSLIIFLHVNSNFTHILNECKLHGIPTIAIVDNSTVIKNITHLIPSNTKSFESIKFIMDFITKDIR